MASISRDIINKIKAEIDIVELIGEYVDLNSSGKNYVALCPFHQENTPSFTVNPNKQFYYCFGCGAGGDSINFIQEIDNLSFQESVLTLAERAGIEVDIKGGIDQEQMKLREAIFSANELAAKFYNYLLLNKDIAKKAREYLENRGFKEDDIKKFNLGYSPDSWRALYKFLSDKNFNLEVLLKSGLIAAGKNNSYYDRFRNRVIFPIYNVRSEVIGFGGRIIDPEDFPKYLNSPETPVFSKKKLLYGLNISKEGIQNKNEAVIVEGYTDVLTACRYGLNNFVASLGTALTREQANLLNRYCDKVYIAYDADTAGDKATLRGLEILRQAGLDVAIIELPEELDPDDYIKNNGSEAFINLETKAPDLIDYRLDLIMEKYQDQSANSRLKAAKAGVKFLATIKDELTQDAYAKVLAEKTEIGYEEIKNKIEKVKKEKMKNNRWKRKNKSQEKSRDEKTNDPEWQVLACILQNQEYRELGIDKLNPEYFSDSTTEIARQIWNDIEITATEVISALSEEKRDNLARYFLIKDSLPSKKEFKNLIKEVITGNIENEISNILFELNNSNDCSYINDLLLYYKRLLRLERRDG
ncbi:MAG: DNA primase [Halarsenatibacteraceae bacterium]